MKYGETVRDGVLPEEASPRGLYTNLEKHRMLRSHTARVYTYISGWTQPVNITDYACVSWSLSLNITSILPFIDFRL